MSFRLLSVISTLLGIGGSAALALALLFGLASILSFIERLQHGRGLLFADVEFFALLAVFCGVSGGIAVFIARKLSKPRPRHPKPPPTPRGRNRLPEEKGTDLF